MGMFFSGGPMIHDGAAPKTIGIVTTASLPWLTGASIVPLLHAIYLKKRGFATTLYLPWLPPDHQRLCFQREPLPNPEAQHAYIKGWLPEPLRSLLPDVRFYPGRYSTLVRSIRPLRDLGRVVRPADVIILEGPEHLFFCHPFSRFKRLHRTVVGIILTNYSFYHGQVLSPPLVRIVQRYLRFVMERMCHEVVAVAPVQGAICSLPRCRVIPVNAVMSEFFQPPPRHRSKACYFIGTLVPEKGLSELFRGLQAAGIDSIDLFGKGSMEWVQKTALGCGVRPVFKGITERPWEDLAAYRVFVNCSRCECFCTTTANALAMQQWVIVPRHASNEVFYPFKNCLVYGNLDELKSMIEHACTHTAEYDPKVAELSWDAATDRLINAVLR